MPIDVNEIKTLFYKGVKLSHGKLNNLPKVTQEVSKKAVTGIQWSNPGDCHQPSHTLLLYFVKQNRWPHHVSVMWGTLGRSSAVTYLAARWTAHTGQLCIWLHSSLLSKSRYLNMFQVGSYLRKDSDERENCPRVLHGGIHWFHNDLLSAAMYLAMT